ncbi:MAG TPA: hypothetical protein VF337_06175 [Candidatus Limnocylindrales bacterium]
MAILVPGTSFCPQCGMQFAAPVPPQVSGTQMPSMPPAAIQPPAAPQFMPPPPAQFQGPASLPYQAPPAAQASPYSFQSQQPYQYQARSAGSGNSAGTMFLALLWQFRSCGCALVLTLGSLLFVVLLAVLAAR